MTIQINIVAGSQSLGKYSIGSKTVVLGRSKSCDISVPSTLSEISAKHISLKEQGSILWILDGDGNRASTNGVYLNGSRITPSKWISIPEKGIVQLGSPNGQNSLQISLDRQSPPRQAISKSGVQSQSIQAKSAPVPVQLTNTGINVALVRPERKRNAWKTPINLMIHLVGLGVCIAILPSIMGSTLDAGIAIIIVVALEIYFFPSTISFNRDQPNRFAILALNLFMGWTLIGWLVCLVWSLTAR